MRNPWGVVVGALLLGVSGAGIPVRIAHALEHTVLGRTFVVKDPIPGIDATPRSVVALGKEPASDDTLVGDPLANGATLEILANGEVPSDQTFDLPAGPYASGGHGWKASGRPPIGFVWKDPAGQVGPVKVALIKKSKSGTFLVKAVVKGALGPGPEPHIAVVPPAPGTDGGMIVRIGGGDAYCVAFGGAAGGAVTNAPRGTADEVFKIVGTKTAALTEAGCPQGAGPTTTVTTSSSTSTSVTTSTSSSTTVSTSSSTTSSSSSTTSSSSTSTSSSTMSSTSSSTSTSRTTTSSSSSTTSISSTSTSRTTTSVNATSSSTTTSTSSTSSTTAAAVCGNGIVEGTEECDDGNEISGDACTNHCTIARCGDGVVRTGVEQCDDGNLADTDCCRTDCTSPPPTCGNGCLEPGESCDDGNTVGGDNCPANCVIAPCTPSGTLADVRVSFARPSGVTVGAITIFLDYPDGKVSIPGSGADGTVVARISNTPANFSSSPFDLDYAMRETIAAFNRTLNPGAIFDVGFDTCVGSATLRRSDFTCTVEEASTPTGANITPLTGFSCSVSIL